MSLKIDIRRVLGLADPTIGDPSVPSGSQLSDYPGVYWKSLTTWLKENYKFTCLIIAVLGIFLVSLLKRHR